MGRLHVYVHGRVQGVFYRRWTKKRADFLNLSGWVKNLEDSRVEIIAEGKKENLERFIEDLRSGPPLSRVDRIDVSSERATGEYNSFEIKWK
jgi:acylphosphatase